jgi:gliding motility-associated-like protein
MKCLCLLWSLVWLVASNAAAQNFIFAELQGQPTMITTGWSLNGGAYVGDTNGDADPFNNELVLVDPINSTSGSIFFNQPVDLNFCTRWTATFDFRIFDGNAADGLAFCFIDVPPAGFVVGGGVGIPATANGLKIVFDTYDNGCGANPEIQIYSGPGYDECIPGIVKVNNTGGNLNFIRSNAYNTAVVQYDNGFIDVTVNGTTYLSAVYAPVTFAGYLGFTSGTGAQNDRHSLRNVTIYTDGTSLGGFLSLDSTSTWPVVQANCYDSAFDLKTVGKFRCSTVDPGGSDFRLYDPNGYLLQIASVSASCTDDRSDSMHLRMGVPFARNGDHYLVLRQGIDGNVILGDCGAELFAFDTVIIRVNDCYNYNQPVHMRNVTVQATDDSVLLHWEYPTALDTAFFNGYRVQMNEQLAGTIWQDVALVTAISDTSIVLASLQPRAESRDFRVILQVRANPDCPPGDSISNIWLSNPDGQLANTDALEANFEWTPYDKAWPMPVYQLYFLKDGDSLLVATTENTSINLKKPLINGNYKAVIRTNSPSDTRSSRSNALDFTVEVKEVKIYNVITPNGDGMNDVMQIDNLQFYPGTKLHVFNRWGQEVYSSMDYQNNWSPTDLSAGNYYYKLLLPNQKQYEGSIRIVK